jgi:hypothetical protein
LPKRLSRIGSIWRMINISVVTASVRAARSSVLSRNGLVRLDGVALGGGVSPASRCCWRNRLCWSFFFSLAL